MAGHQRGFSGHGHQSCVPATWCPFPHVCCLGRTGPNHPRNSMMKFGDGYTHTWGSFLSEKYRVNMVSCFQTRGGYNGIPGGLFLHLTAAVFRESEHRTHTAMRVDSVLPGCPSCGSQRPAHTGPAPPRSAAARHAPAKIHGTERCLYLRRSVTTSTVNQCQRVVAVVRSAKTLRAIPYSSPLARPTSTRKYKCFFRNCMRTTTELVANHTWRDT